MSIPFPPIDHAAHERRQAACAVVFVERNATSAGPSAAAARRANLHVHGPRMSRRLVGDRSAQMAAGKSIEASVFPPTVQEQALQLLLPLLCGSERSVSACLNPAVHHR
jgi:hypothetical protein